jgi:hypothetical protein
MTQEIKKTTESMIRFDFDLLLFKFEIFDSISRFLCIEFNEGKDIKIEFS